jgi:probable rRNA maturation factor
LKIKIFYDRVKYRVRGSKRIKALIERVIRKESKIPGDLIFIFTDDRKIREINKEFLKHNYNTDVIAFNYSEEEVINGEIYISIETVRINAHNYKISLYKEILRVLIHGTLHLCGYDDKNRRERNNMRRMEDHWICKMI